MEARVTPRGRGRRKNVVETKRGRGRGRPSVSGEGDSPILHVRVGPRHLAVLDRLVENGRAKNRSEAARWVIERAIDLGGVE